MHDHTATDVRRYLGTLGDTPEEIAARLAAAGVCGTPRMAWHCPLAIALRRVFPGLAVLVLSHGAILPGGRVDLPSACRFLVKKFDAGLLPQLEVSR